MNIVYNVCLLFCLYWYIIISKLITVFVRKKYSKNQKKDVLFLECLPIVNAGYNYRSKKWAEKLEDLGLICEIKTIIEDREKFGCVVQKSNLTHFFCIINA